MKFFGEAREELRAALCAEGFDAVRFVSAERSMGRGIDPWLAAGYHADMAWLERGAEKRRDATLVLSGVRSVILLGVNYWPGAEATAAQEGGAWARYALHADYHDTIRVGLESAGKILQARSGCSGEDYRYYVDTGPVLERGWAAEAGLGFIGKNGMLISREHGNWLFLAAILTRLEIEPDASILEAFPSAARLAAEQKRTVGVASAGLLCGKCTRCMDACPTEAFPEAGVLDARHCISYHTIENRGVIPRELRRSFGARIYGCDVCAEVCPWNRFAQASRSVLLERRYEIAELRLIEVLRLTPERFQEIFRGTAMKRVKLAGLLRNACIAAGNVWRGGGQGSAAPESFAGETERAEAISAVLELARHASPLVRGHAVWAAGEILGAEAALEALRAARVCEIDAAVREEYENLA